MKYLSSNALCYAKGAVTYGCGSAMASSILYSCGSSSKITALTSAILFAHVGGIGALSQGKDYKFWDRDCLVAPCCVGLVMQSFGLLFEASLRNQSPHVIEQVITGVVTAPIEALTPPGASIAGAGMLAIGVMIAAMPIIIGARAIAEGTAAVAAHSVTMMNSLSSLITKKDPLTSEAYAQSVVEAVTN